MTLGERSTTASSTRSISSNAIRQRRRPYRNYINGWSVNSKQSQIYARGAIEAKAMEIAKKLQAELYLA